MEEDKSASGGTQEPPPSTNQRSVDFLDSFGGFDKNNLFLAGSIPSDKGLVVIGRYSDEALLKLPDNQRHHVTAATYPAGLASRDDSQIESVPFIVFDDIGRVIPAAEGTTSISDGIEIDEGAFENVAKPSWKMETRRGRYQYGYHFDPPLSPAMAKAILAALKRHPLFAPGLHSAGQYFRLPSGTNTKPDGRGFRTRLTELNDSWTEGMFCREFGLDLTAPDAAAGAGKSTGLETLSLEAVKALLDLIPNNRPEGGDPRKGRHYDQWTRTGHAVWGATGGEGFEQFDEWSSKSDKYDKDLTREKWGTYSNAKGSASTLRKIIEEIHGVNSPERQEAQRIFAKDEEMFPDLDPNEIPKIPSREGNAKANGVETQETQLAEFTELLKEARRLTKIPAKFRKEYDDPNWLENDQFADAFALASVIQPASPTLFPPFDRGVVSVRTGAPFVGKSLLLLNQVCAFCFGRADLLGSGFTDADIQFQGDVLYFSNEDSEPVVLRRVAAWMKHWGLKAGDTPHRVHVVRSPLLTKKGTSTLIECLRVLRTAVKHLRSGRSISMVVIDTMAASVNGIEENSSKETGEVLTMLKDIAWAFWTSVVFIHHGTKVAWKAGGDEADLASALRGSGNFGGVVRGADNVRKLKEAEKAKWGWSGRKVVGLSVLKASDSGDVQGERFFELETVEIEAEHAEKGHRVLKRMPVLVPLQPPMAGAGLFRDEAAMVDCWDKLVKGAAAGQVWHYKRLPRRGPVTGVMVHDLWGMTPSEATLIVEEWVDEGRISIQRRTVKAGTMADQIVIQNEADEVF